jgi:N-acetylglucosamine kinase-like BadF-type ATPase
MGADVPALPAVLVIDGGNSKTDVALVAVDGTVLAQQRGGGTNPQGLGDDVAMSRLGSLVSGAAAAAGLAPAAVAGHAPVAASTFACLAGADLPDEEEHLADLVRARHWSAAGTVVNDTFAVLRAGVTGTCGPDGRLQAVAHPGVAVTCGAGINCVGVAPAGQVTRFLSLGYISGDWGGGTDLGHAALWWAVRAEDGRGPQTSLRAAVAGHFGAGEVRDVVVGLHRGTIAQAELRGLVPALFAAAASGDTAARELVQRQADEVTTMAVTAIRRLGLGGTPVPVVLGGSVLSAADPLLTGLITARLAREAPLAIPRLVDVPPVAGAALLGLDQVGSPAGAETRLRAAFSPPGVTRQSG